MKDSNQSNNHFHSLVSLPIHGSEQSQAKIKVAQIYQCAQELLSFNFDVTTQSRDRFEESFRFLEKSLNNNIDVYGITTGYGDSCVKQVAEADSARLAVNLSSFHGCGLGKYFSVQETRAILACRLVSLAQGLSGIQLSLLEEILFC